MEGGLPEIDNNYSYQLSGDLISTLAYYQIDSLALSIADTVDLHINITDGLCFSNISVDIYRCRHLPLIVLFAFTGEVINEGHLLKWVIDSEINNSHFIIDVSKDAINFENVDAIQGLGTTSRSVSY